MGRAVKAFAFVFLLAVTAYASDSINQFSFQTVDGKTIVYKAGNGSAMVVNIGSHW